MMLWHFVICDDEESSRQDVKQRLYRSLDKLQIDRQNYEVIEYADVTELRSCPVTPTILFLDVLFNGQNKGIQIFRQLHLRWPGMPIVFVSSIKKPVWDSFDGYLTAYIPKSILDQKFHPTVSTIIGILQEKLSPPFVEFKIQREVYRILLSDILYIDIDGRHLHLHTLPRPNQPDPFFYRGTIQKEGHRLADFGFYHLHKSMLICLSSVAELHRGRLVMYNGESILFNAELYTNIKFNIQKVQEKYEWSMLFHLSRPS